MIPIKWWFVEKNTKNLDKMIECCMGFARLRRGQKALVFAPDRVILMVPEERPVMLQTLEYQATLIEGVRELENKILGDLEFFAHRIRGRYTEDACPVSSDDEGTIYGVLQSFGLKHLEQPMISIRLGLAFSNQALDPLFISPELTIEQTFRLRLPTIA